MANIYVRSTDGSDSDAGGTWAFAKATLAGAAVIDAAGDTIYVSQAHAESSSTAQTITLAGTLAAPVRVICGNDAAEPPTAVATTGTITTTGANGITTQGGGEFYGLTFSVGTGAVNAQLTLNTYAVTGNLRQRFESCEFLIPATGSGANIRINNSGASANNINNVTEFYNCNVETKLTAGTPFVIAGRFIWNGGSLKSGQASSSGALFSPFSTAGRVCSAEISGVNLQYMGTTQPMFVANNTTAHFVLRNCRLPASWTGTFVSGTLTIGDYYAMFNCDSGDTNYRIYVQTYAGTIVEETVIVRTGGASDGTTPLSWKMVTGADAEYPTITLNSPEIVRWNETTGSSITVTVETITDNVTLTDAECWLEVQYLGTSGVPLGGFISDVKADLLATAANQTTSSETWTTTGLTTPVKQKLSVSFTPQEKGYIHAVVKVAKASTTVYVDPELTVT